MVIREVEHDDIPALAELAVETYTEAFGHSFAPEELATQLRETRSVAYFRSAMERDAILVAVVEGKPAGYVQIGNVAVEVRGVRPGPNDQAINALYVRSGYRGRGIGRALMDAALAHPRAATAEHVFVDVWEENERAVALYRSYGFRVTGTCPVTVGSTVVGEDLVLVRPAQWTPLE